MGEKGLTPKMPLERMQQHVYGILKTTAENVSSSTDRQSNKRSAPGQGVAMDRPDDASLAQFRDMNKPCPRMVTSGNYGIIKFLNALEGRIMPVRLLY